MGTGQQVVPDQPCLKRGPVCPRTNDAVAYVTPRCPIVVALLDEVGSPFYCRRKGEDQVLKPQSIAGNATAQNTEWASRPGIALSQVCRVAEMGHSVLRELFPSKADLPKSVAATGVNDLERALGSAELPVETDTALSVLRMAAF